MTMSETTQAVATAALADEADEPYDAIAALHAPCPRCGRDEYFDCDPACWDAAGVHWRTHEIDARKARLAAGTEHAVPRRLARSGR